jgi:hypothetical protein
VADETPREVPAQELLKEREQRIRTAVALGAPDRVPVVPNGPAWPAKAMGVKAMVEAVQ